MGNNERLRRIWKLAEEDLIYDFWNHMHQEAHTAFHEYANQCPDDIKQILLGYAGAGEMKFQRMVNIACNHMVFEDELNK